MDERGMILAPSKRGKDFALNPGMEFELIEEKGMLVLKPVIPKPVQVQSKKQNWGEKASLDAGKVTFDD
ncbi:MAG: hypothetical protein QXJ63_02915 [Candidatus Bathyarchaeia archaeon]